MTRYTSQGGHNEFPISAKRWAESAQFIGAPIVGPYREPMGSISGIIIDRSRCRALCIIATFELLELEGFYPIPWMAFKFNRKISGYQTHLVKRQLIAAPQYPTNDSWISRSAEIEETNGYYGRCY